MTTAVRGALAALRTALAVQLDMRALQAQTSSYEYDVLVDVISGLLIGPLPEPQLMKRHVPPSPVEADDSLVELKAALRPSGQEMRSRQHTLAGLTRCAARFLTHAADPHSPNLIAQDVHTAHRWRVVGSPAPLSRTSLPVFKAISFKWSVFLMIRQPVHTAAHVRNCRSSSVAPATDLSQGTASPGWPHVPRSRLSLASSRFSTHQAWSYGCNSSLLCGGDSSCDCRHAPAFADRIRPGPDPHDSVDAPLQSCLPDLFDSSPSTEPGSRHHSPAKPARRTPSSMPVASLPTTTSGLNSRQHHRKATANSDTLDVIDPLLCPLRASVVTMSASRTSACASAATSSAATAAAAEADPSPDAADGPWIRPSPATSPGGIGGASASPGTDSLPSATDRCGSLRMAGVQSATTSPEPGLPPRPPVHRKAISMGAGGWAWAMGAPVGGGGHRGHAGEGSSWREHGRRVMEEELEAEASGLVTSSQMQPRPVSPQKPAHRLRSQLEAGVCFCAVIRRLAGAVVS